MFFAKIFQSGQNLAKIVYFLKKLRKYINEMQMNTSEKETKYLLKKAANGNRTIFEQQT